MHNSDQDEIEKERIHLNIYEYQKQYLKEQGYNASRVVRQALDDRMEQDGADPENWKNTYD